jgi:Uma2 family endonuclease
MSTNTLPRATLDDLMKVDGKAELINGRIVRAMPTGTLPTRLAKRILLALDPHVVASGVGEVFGDSLGYAIDPPLPSGRQSFSPDVSYYNGPLPANLMKFIQGAPNFAVEVRSENDYGPAKEREHAAKRGDYFAAGTLVVWDVDPIAETVTSYTAADPTAPKVFRRGEAADAEPAVPGWRLSVDALFA